LYVSIISVMPTECLDQLFSLGLVMLNNISWTLQIIEVLIFSFHQPPTCPLPHRLGLWHWHHWRKRQNCYAVRTFPNLFM
jgi:hypothetical protein